MPCQNFFLFIKMQKNYNRYDTSGMTRLGEVTFHITINKVTKTVLKNKV